MNKAPTFLPEERAHIQSYLSSTYKGVFSDKSLESHYWNHAELEFANYTTQVIVPRLAKGATLLDIGSGFGSCVLAARNVGFDAKGIEISEFEVECARSRLSRERPGDKAEKVYWRGDARELSCPPESFDAITMWNVLEHIEDCRDILQSAICLLKKGGIVFIICPNYMAWRQEAHYHVPWKPSFLLPKEQGSAYLKDLGKDPTYFENAIYYRTNREIIDLLSQLGMEVRELGNFENREVTLRRVTVLLRSPLKHLKFHNPFRHSVEVAARKV